MGALNSPCVVLIQYVMTAVLVLVENLVEVTQSVTLHCLCAVLLIDRSNRCWSRHKC